MSEEKKTLAEEMHLLFDEDEDVKEWILIGKLPPDIAEIAALSLEKKENPEQRPISLGSPEPFMHIAGLIQRRFWPNAPGLAKGGFMSMLMGGPAPSWVIIMQVAAQIVDKVRESGFEVEECDMEKMAHDLRNKEDDLDPET